MRRALTLIEILVVFAAVGVLAALLFPTFEKARGNARRSSCQSNLKQILLGFKQYCRDYDEKYLLAYTNYDSIEGYNPAVDKGWGESVQPYLKSISPFQCPNELTPLKFPPMESDYWLAAPTIGIADSKFADQRLTIILGEGAQSAAAIIATHGAITYTGDAPSFKYNGEIWDITGATEGKGGRRHLEGSNFGFVDGHVKWLKPETIKADPISAGKPTFRVK